jgi:hypothetical protein
MSGEAVRRARNTPDSRAFVSYFVHLTDSGDDQLFAPTRNSAELSLSHGWRHNRGAPQCLLAAGLSVK